MIACEEQNDCQRDDKQNVGESGVSECKEMCNHWTDNQN